VTLDELRTQKRDAILAIASRHGVTAVRVFGSFARGEAGPGSDLDLLIERGARRTPFFPGGLVADLERELGRKVDIASPSALHPSLRDSILREAVPL
jgi:predicted nucleotidyltransferase